MLEMAMGGLKKLTRGSNYFWRQGVSENGGSTPAMIFPMDLEVAYFPTNLSAREVFNLRKSSTQTARPSRIDIINPRVFFEIFRAEIGVPGQSRTIAGNYGGNIIWSLASWKHEDFPPDFPVQVSLELEDPSGNTQIGSICYWKTMETNGNAIPWNFSDFDPYKIIHQTIETLKHDEPAAGCWVNCGIMVATGDSR